MITNENYIPLDRLCTNYKVEMTFFNKLSEIGLIEVTTIKQTLHIHEDKITDLEKMIRMHHDLEINFEGIDTVFNLLEKIDELQLELGDCKNKLKRYEGED
jgi:chaperone modulatory protein CbpM